MFQAFLIVRALPEWKTKLDRIVQEDDFMLFELELVDKPLELDDPFKMLIVPNHLGIVRMTEVESLFVVKLCDVALIINVSCLSLAFAGRVLSIMEREGL